MPTPEEQAAEAARKAAERARERINDDDQDLGDRSDESSRGRRKDDDRDSVTVDRRRRPSGGRD